MTHEQYLTRQEVSDYLKTRWNLTYSPKTLQKLAVTGGGPQYCIFGNKAVSTSVWIDNWVREKMTAPRVSTSESIGN